MTARTSIVLSLLCSTLAPHLAGQAPRPLSVDSALVQYVGRLTVERLASSIASAAQSTQRKWWDFRFPQSGVPEMWQRLRVHLNGALLGRDSMAGDSTYGLVHVGRIRLNPTQDTLWFDLDIGGAYRCKGQWLGNTRDVTYMAHRSENTWMFDLKTTYTAYSESFDCRR